MRNHEFYQTGCDFTEDGVRCGQLPHDPIHLAGQVNAEATEVEPGTFTQSSPGTKITDGPFREVEIDDQL